MTAPRGIPELQVAPAETARLREAGAVVSECRRAFASCQGGILGTIAAGGEAFADWRHHPAGDVYDSQSHAQYFYHAHPIRQRPAAEHGHFHTFLRAEGMPIGVAPLLLPELAVADVPAVLPQAAPLKRGTRDEVSHLIAIAIDSRGEPTRLFTTNRWVTGEAWYRADDVIRMLDRFAITTAEPSEALNRWIGAVIRLFRPQIAALLRARDDTVMAWRRRRRTHVFEDPRLEVTSSLDIELDAQLAFVDGVGFRSAERTLQRVPGLPQMGEGWEEGRVR